MSRPSYSEYVKSAMRFYSRHLNPTAFRSEAGRKNWYACDKAISTYSMRDREILVSAYGGFDSLAENVLAAAKRYRLPQRAVWDMMKEFERKVAENRGLI